ncbi:MAG: methyltransferase domain-containing protein [Deltaproteobacteria bacterium]|nr:methyltransferase domain-containing protein [Deltaproteobacteria bacterium]
MLDDLVRPPGDPTRERTERILRHVPRAGKLLELGASFAPVVPRAGGWNTFLLDHATAPELREKYLAHGVDVSRVEEVDFVWRHGALEDAVPEAHHGTFDACVASHVIEHMPDLVAFFGALERLLRPEGVVALAVPDKRTCFDFFQAHTTTAEVLEAHQAHRSRHSPRTAFRALAYASSLDGQIAWSQGPTRIPSLVHRALAIPLGAFDATDDSDASPYVDHHASCFTPASFELLLFELGQLGLVRFRVLEVGPSVGCEFTVTLARGAEALLPDAEQTARRESFLRRMLVETRESLDAVLGAPALPRSTPPPSAQDRDG